MKSTVVDSLKKESTEFEKAQNKYILVLSNSINELTKKLEVTF